MEKDTTIAWLKNNSEKPDQEVKDFLHGEINKDQSNDKWHSYYFLEDLKSPANGFPKRILKLIKEVQNTTKKRRSWSDTFFVSLFIFILAHGSEKSTGDELIIIIVAVIAGLVYFYLKSKLSQKYRAWKIALIIIVIYVISAALIGFITGLADNWQALAVRTPFGSQIVSNDVATVKQLEATMGADIDVFQNQSNVYENNVDEQTQSVAVYRSNIKDYQALEKLNDEEYATAETYFPQISDIFEKYSQSLSSAVTAFLVADKNATDGEDSVFSAKINYYQALLDNDTNAEIEADIQTVNDAVANFNDEQSVLTQAQQNLQEADEEFSSN